MPCPPTDAGRATWARGDSEGSRLVPAFRRTGGRELETGVTHRWVGREAPRRDTRRCLAAESGCGPGVSYPRRMSDIPRLVAAIDGRLAEISAEMSALGAAKAELAAPRAASQAPGVAVEAIANQSPRRTARRGLTPPGRQSERSLRRRVAERVEATRDAGGAAPPQRSTRKRTTTVARRQSAGNTVQAAGPRTAPG